MGSNKCCVMGCSNSRKRRSKLFNVLNGKFFFMVLTCFRSCYNMKTTVARQIEVVHGFIR
jgi:hypothetical protein